MNEPVTAGTRCGQCGGWIPIGMGHTCVSGPSFQFPGACAPAAPYPTGAGKTSVLVPFTEADVRRIVREELERLGLGKSDGRD